MNQLSEDYPVIFDNATSKLAAYINEHELKSLVLGISGGIDSAVTAAMACEAIKKSEANIPLIGRSIAIETNKPDEIARAKAIGKNFCADFKELDLTRAYADMIQGMEAGGYGVPPDSHEGRVAKGNIKARMRMIQLYHLAGMTKGIVLSTDNYTELLMGFWTLHGDVGDYGMIQNLWKTEVYGMARWLCDVLDDEGDRHSSDALFACIDAVPTDGLGVSNSDLDQLGASSYAEVDEILINYLNFVDRIKHPVIDRYERTFFKRENPVNLTRKELLP